MSTAKRKIEADKERRVKLRGGSGEVADWASVDAATIRATVAVVALTGGAIRFGYSRDGGAYAVGIYGDGEPYTIYARPFEDVNGILEDIAEGFREMGGSAK